jgi:hypothetical protein
VRADSLLLDAAYLTRRAAAVYTAVFVPWEVAFMDSAWPWTPGSDSPSAGKYMGSPWPGPGDQRIISSWEPPVIWAAIVYVADRWTDAVFMADILLTFNLGSYDVSALRFFTTLSP